ncbi:MAG: TIGR01777 family protein [Nitrospirae bacterium]|nr:TIGR01777 family protein [Nitrospirota bacterium]MBF0534351.1 TIGR01777 family protein [Nitrospirota bacterium]MBF0615668.1 TIGR01777 family protein [Nitrospirota bacterium]
MRAFVTGATGFVGRELCRKLLDEGIEVTALIRRSELRAPLPSGVTLIKGNPMEEGSWYDAVSDCDIAINLAGYPIFTRWNEQSKKLIRESRVFTTRSLTNALIRHREGKKTVLISTSATGYYGDTGQDLVYENTPAGRGFLAKTAQEWESSAMKAKSSGIRVVITRFGVVLGKGGGALKAMLPAFKLNLGSPLGNAKQWFPWIHIKDLLEIFLFAIRNDKIEGPINCTSPGTVNNGDFSRALASALGKFYFLPSVPEFVLKLALGEVSTVVLQGQRAIAQKLLSNGFSFKYSGIDSALKDIFSL